MKLNDTVKLGVNFDARLDSPNIFADVFGSHSALDWTKVVVESIENAQINGVEFPTFPSIDAQNIIHGHCGEDSILEAAAFYEFVCGLNLAGPTSTSFGTGWLMDFGSGWGRILRLFLRDFPLSHIIGYEPRGMFATMARANNPYVAFLNGSYLPDGSLPEAQFDLITGWSIYSHLSEIAVVAWLKESARILKTGGSAVYTTWGLRFLERLKAEEQQLKAGDDIHWYSKVCLLGAGDIDKRLESYKSGEFVWFNSSQNDLYGEAFLSQVALERIIRQNKLQLTVTVFDTKSLYQDVFVVKKTRSKWWRR